jgi:hypothetical protein
MEHVSVWSSDVVLEQSYVQDDREDDTAMVTPSPSFTARLSWAIFFHACCRHALDSAFAMV